MKKSASLIFSALSEQSKTFEVNDMSDLCTDNGAARLAAKIEDYWRKKGFDVRVDLRPEGFVSTMRSARTDVRSDMVNGMPRRIGFQAG